MNQRERVLLGVLLGMLIIGGGGSVGYFFFYDPYITLCTQLAAEEAKRDKELAELQAEEKEQKRLLEVDPRLKEWTKISLPTRAGAKDDAGKRSPEAVTKHTSSVQVKYEQYLRDLLQQSGFVT